MSTSIFKQSVAKATTRPKGAVVSVDLFRALASEQAISRKVATPWGLPVPSLGLELPYFDGDVYLACDPSLDGFEFKLPPE